MVDFLFQGILYLICANYCILLPLSTRGARLSLLFTALAFKGMRLKLYLGFSQTLDVANLAIINTDFSILLHTI